MLDGDGYVKLIDFGLAKQIEDGKLRTSHVGTPQYMSPEIYRGDGHSFETDWWAVGILIFELMFGNTPFYSMISR